MKKDGTSEPAKPRKMVNRNTCNPLSLWCWFLTGLWGCTQTTLAGPPFITDDPEPVEFQHWEYYLASQHTRTKDGWTGLPALIEINYGIISNTQVHLIAPLAYDTPNQGPTHLGYGDTEIGLKYRFIQETPERPQIGGFPLIEFPTGKTERNLGSGHIGTFLPLWLQKSWGQEDRKWTTYGGGGYHINPGANNRDWTFLGWVLQRQITDKVLLGGEVYYHTPTQFHEEDETAFNLATIIDLSALHHILLSAGRSMDGPTEFQAYVAYQLTFGP